MNLINLTNLTDAEWTAIMARQITRRMIRSWEHLERPTQKELKLISFVVYGNNKARVSRHVIDNNIGHALTKWMNEKMLSDECAINEEGFKEWLGLWSREQPKPGARLIYLLVHGYEALIDKDEEAKKQNFGLFANVPNFVKE